MFKYDYINIITRETETGNACDILSTERKHTYEYNFHLQDERCYSMSNPVRVNIQ